MASPSSSVIKGLNLPRDPETRKEVYGGIVKEYIRLGAGRKLRIMVVGEAGQGKSTLINALVGKKIAEEGAEFEAGTTKTQEYKLTQNGVHMGVWDTPGFGVGEEEEDQNIVESLQNSDCHPLDLALFCMRMDITRIPTRVHIDTIRKLTEVFGRNFWKHCVFVLTFANNVEQLCPADEEMEHFFSNRLVAIEDKFRHALSKHAHLSDEEVAHVRAVPVGSAKEGHEKVRQNPWALPDREDWFLGFWMDIGEQMHSSALSALLQANYHRIEAPSGDTGVSASGCPPPDIEPHLRLVESTEEERLQLKDQMKNDLVVIAEADETRYKYATSVGSIEEPEKLPSLSTSDIKSSHQQLAEEGSSPIQIEYKKKLVENSVKKELAVESVHTVSGGQEASVDGVFGGNHQLEESSQFIQGFECVDDSDVDVDCRPIPWCDILLDHLNNKNSGFFAYVSNFSRLRGSSLPFFGHIGGIVEGMSIYLTKKGQRAKKSASMD